MAKHILKRPLAPQALSSEAIALAVEKLTEISGPMRPAHLGVLEDQFEEQTEVRGGANIPLAIRSGRLFVRFVFVIQDLDQPWVTVEVDRRTALLTVSVATNAAKDPAEASQTALKYANPFAHPDYGHSPEDSELKRLRSDAAEAVAAAKANAEESEKLLNIQREALEHTAINRHAEAFRQEASEHEKLARWCVALAIISVVALLGVAVAFFVVKLDGSDGEIAGHILARLTLLSIPATALGVCVRQYSAARHNWVVARHRYNALSTYAAFAASTDKDVLLAQALALIFSPQDTGYSKPASAPDSIALFSELLKQIGSSGKG